MLSCHTMWCSSLNGAASTSEHGVPIDYGIRHSFIYALYTIKLYSPNETSTDLSTSWSMVLQKLLDTIALFLKFCFEKIPGKRQMQKEKEMKNGEFLVTDLI